jgi:hypothetical protein
MIVLHRGVRRRRPLLLPRANTEPTGKLNTEDTERVSLSIDFALSVSAHNRWDCPIRKQPTV